MAENSGSNRRKGRKRFFFGNEIDLDRFLKEIREYYMREMTNKTEKSRKKKLYPLAYSVTLGPYGRVYIRELGHFGCFSNIQSSLTPNQELKPLVDIIEEDDKVHVVVELPQVDKEQIKIIGTEKNLIIQVNNRSQQPSMNLNLPCYVDPDTAKATLKNGVLEIIMKIERSSSFKVKRIDIN